MDVRPAGCQVEVGDHQPVAGLDHGPGEVIVAPVAERCLDLLQQTPGFRVGMRCAGRVEVVGTGPQQPDGHGVADEVGHPVQDEGDQP